MNWFTDIDDPRRMTRTSSNFIVLSIFIRDLINVNTAVLGAQCEIAAIGGEFETIHSCATIVVNGDQLPGGGIEHNPSASRNCRHNENISIRRKCGSLGAFLDKLAPHNQMWHCVPQVDKLVISRGYKLILGWMNRQGIHFFRMTLRITISKFKKLRSWRLLESQAKSSTTLFLGEYNFWLYRQLSLILCRWSVFSHLHTVREAIRRVKICASSLKSYFSFPSGFLHTLVPFDDSFVGATTSHYFVILQCADIENATIMGIGNCAYDSIRILMPNDDITIRVAG